MRAPAHKRSDGEIIDDILKFADCLCGKKLIRRLIADLRADLLPITGNKTQNAAFAKKVRKQIDKLEQILETEAPNKFVLPAIFGDRFWSLWCWGRPVGPQEPDLIFAINPRTRNYLEEDAGPKLFLADLRRARSRCNTVIELQLGAHGGLDHRHVHAALAAKALLEAAATEAGTEPRLTYSPTGPFCRVASLFWEAASDEYDMDLQRACKAVLSAKIPE